MRLPSLFRTPKYQRFRIEPRYYDPVKEDIKNRTRRIEGELKAEKRSGQPSSLRGAFNRRAGITDARMSSLRQLIIIVLFLVLSFGYLEYGNVIFNILWLGVPVYIFYRVKQIRRRTS